METALTRSHQHPEIYPLSDEQKKNTRTQSVKVHFVHPEAFKYIHPGKFHTYLCTQKYKGVIVNRQTHRGSYKA